MSAKKTPAPKPAEAKPEKAPEPEQKPDEAPEAIEAAEAAAEAPSYEELAKLVGVMQQKIATLEGRADTAGLPAPQSVHIGPKEPVTRKLKSGTFRTDF